MDTRLREYDVRRGYDVRCGHDVRGVGMTEERKMVPPRHPEWCHLVIPECFYRGTMFAIDTRIVCYGYPPSRV